MNAKKVTEVYHHGRKIDGYDLPAVKPLTYLVLPLEGYEFSRGFSYHWSKTD
jgi:hypothetical protein